MPANKNAVIRYKFLDDLLSDRLHYYSMEELTEKVNERLEDLGYSPVVSRTLEKDLVFLQERPFCIPLERNRKGGKSYIKYSSRSFSIFTHELSNEEISLLCEVLNTVGQFSGLPNFDWLDGLRDEMGFKKQKQVLSFSNNPLLKNTNILAKLYEFVANDCVLNLVYQRFTESTPEYFTLHPYLLKEYNNRWYLVGWQPDKDRIFTLAIDRIIEFEHLAEEKFNPYKGNIEDHFKDTIGITVYDDSAPEDIIFWASNIIVPYIETKPFHQSQSKDVFDVMIKEANINIKSLQVDGGATANNILMQFQSDILQIDVKKPACLETTALGVAYLAGLKSKYYDDLASISDSHECVATYSPKLNKKEVDKLWKGWKCAVKAAMMFKPGEEQ